MKINLGVFDLPYEYQEATTWEVGARLEQEYELFTHFFNMNAELIGEEVAEYLADILEQEITGGERLAMNHILSRTSAEFMAFLNEERLNGVAHGVPTMAARKGIRHRKKKVVTGEPRPSFIDSGLLLANFIAWVED